MITKHTIVIAIVLGLLMVISLSTCVSLGVHIHAKAYNIDINGDTITISDTLIIIE